MNKSIVMSAAGLFIVGIVLVCVLQFSSLFITNKFTSYSSAVYGLSFRYPKNYVLQQDTLGTSTASHHSISLIDRSALAHVPQNGETPPAIVIQSYPNPDDMTPSSWVRSFAEESNFIRSIGATASTTLAGHDAVRYTWDGLYRAESVVTRNKGNIVMFTVMSIGTSDQIRRDFSAILQSVTFSD